MWLLHDASAAFTILTDGCSLIACRNAVESEPPPTPPVFFFFKQLLSELAPASITNITGRMVVISRTVGDMNTRRLSQVSPRKISRPKKLNAASGISPQVNKKWSASSASCRSSLLFQEVGELSHVEALVLLRPWGGWWDQSRTIWSHKTFHSTPFFNVTFLYLWSVSRSCPVDIIYHHQAELPAALLTTEQSLSGGGGGGCLAGTSVNQRLAVSFCCIFIFDQPQRNSWIFYGRIRQRSTCSEVEAWKDVRMQHTDRHAQT